MLVQIKTKREKNKQTSKQIQNDSQEEEQQQKKDDSDNDDNKKNIKPELGMGWQRQIK